MENIDSPPVYGPTSPGCPLHGKPTRRNSCNLCNSAYMRAYLCKRRMEMPERDLWERARRRAHEQGVPFTVTRDEIFIPPRCPVLGMTLRVGGRRSDHSPSLDRITPAAGYVTGNIRVISDRANRLKGNRTIKQLLRLAENGRKDHRDDFINIVAYLHREQVLAEIRVKASKGGNVGGEWHKVERALNRLFARGNGDRW